MPSARITIKSAVLTDLGWHCFDDKLGMKALWGIDRHGKWQKEEVDFLPGPFEKPVHIGTQGSFGTLAISSRITMSNGNFMTAGVITEQSLIGEIWFEVAGHLPDSVEFSPERCIMRSLTHCSPFQGAKKIAITRCWPNGKKIPERLKPVIKVLKCGGTEYCIFDRLGFEALLASDWENTFYDFSDYCFTNEDGLIEYDIKRSILIFWQITLFRKKNISFQLKYESLQATRFVYFERTNYTTSPVVRGGCACLGPVEISTLELKWSTSSWSPIIGGFFIRGS